MKNQLFLQMAAVVFLCGTLSCQSPTPNSSNSAKPDKIKPMAYKVQKSDEEWKKILGADAYHVLREKGTEAPGTGEYNHHSKKGTYVCGACGAELFTSDQKFDSHCGWPSFDGEIGGGDRVRKIPDYSHGMIRTEIICANCGGHLGHLFDDGPTASGQRYCVNSLSLKFKPKE